MQQLTDFHFFVPWKSNLQGQEGLWPLLKGPSCGFLKDCINTRRSFKQWLTESFGSLSWLPLMQKSSWIRHYVVLKMIRFICFSQVVDHVALEIKVKGKESGFFIQHFDFQITHLDLKSQRWGIPESDLLLNLSCMYLRCFWGKNSIQKVHKWLRYIQFGVHIFNVRQINGRYSEHAQLIYSTLHRPRRWLEIWRYRV